MGKWSTANKGRRYLWINATCIPSFALRIVFCLAAKQDLWGKAFQTPMIVTPAMSKIGYAERWHPFTATKSTTPKSSIRTKTTTTTSRLSMNFLSDFFGSFQEKVNTGGSYNLGIDYESLEFPGPEVGRMAVAITQARRQQSLSDDDDDSSRFHPPRSPTRSNLELATFAGGCFWGLELALQRVEGIEHTLVGYTQGLTSEIRPNYEQVGAGNTHHCEAVLVYFDPSRVSYEEIVSKVILDRIDVTTVNGQGRDFGRHYRTGIYFHTPEQEAIATRLLSEEIAKNPKYSGSKQGVVATEVKRATAFWPAEAYHQRYLEKGGRFGMPQSAEKGNQDEIRCYG